MTAAKAFRRIFSTRSLRKTYIDHIRTKGAIGIDRVRPSRLEPNLNPELEVISRKTRDGSYRFTAFKERLISKGQGKSPRVISIPTARDRIALRALCELLGEIFPGAKLELPHVAIESLGNALASGKFSDYVKLDLETFYPSIPHLVLFRALKQKIRKPEILALLRAAIETPTVPESRGRKGSTANTVGVPQGLAISNLLAEITLEAIDKKYKSRPDIWYFRYVDDILILASPGKAGDIANEIVGSLVAIGLKPHPPSPSGSKSKIAPLTSPFTFLGYEITSSQISIRHESVLKFESSLASIFTSYRHRLTKATSPSEKEQAIALCRWKLNLRITGCIFEGKRLGWVFYFSQITTTARLRAVSHTIDSLLNRFSLTGVLKPKSLIKTHYESRRKNKASHGYIPNFDIMNLTEKREVLSILLGPRKIAKISDKRVGELFSMRIAMAVRELEADLAGLS
jgi:RNA-directed DNA polymerase